MTAEALTNVIENLACRIAQRNGGTLSPVHLLPYLPVSLGLVKECLEAMSDDVAVSSGSGE